MATTSQHINARNDPDLLDRFIAAAEQRDIPNASAWVQENIGRLVSQVVAEGQTIADIHAYAWVNRESYISATPPRPGYDLSAVTDTNLGSAISNITTPTPPPEPLSE